MKGDFSKIYNENTSFKLSCDSRFQRAFSASNCVIKVITLVGSSQGNYFENETACNRRTLKTTVAKQLYSMKKNIFNITLITSSFSGAHFHL